MNADQFRLFFKRAPQQDDLDRVNCDRVGELGHSCCGVCEKHNKPRFQCGCVAPLVAKKASVSP